MVNDDDNDDNDDGDDDDDDGLSSEKATQQNNICIRICCHLEVQHNMLIALYVTMAMG